MKKQGPVTFYPYVGSIFWTCLFCNPHTHVLCQTTSLQTKKFLNGIIQLTFWETMET